MAVSGAAAARVAAQQYGHWLFGGSVLLMAYAWWSAWKRRRRDRWTLGILLVGTLLMSWMWSGRVLLWLGFGA